MKQRTMEEFLSAGMAAQDAVDEAQRRAELAEAPRGPRVAAALERALSKAPEAKTFAADAVIVFDVMRRWYGDGAEHVLTAALELAKVEAGK